MKRAFITGGSGFVGKHLFDRLHDVPDIYLYERNEGINGLLSFKPDVIFHLAGEIYDEGKMFDSNVRLTYNLLEASRMLDDLKAFIYVGSSSEYGRKNKPMEETDILEPTNLYEATKGAGTLLCQAFSKKIRVMVARPFSLYGKYEPEKRLIPTAIRSAKAGWEMKIAPGVHDFIHIDDFIDGLLLMVEKGESGEIYNFGSGLMLSNDDVITNIEQIVGRAVKRKPVGKMHDYDNNCWVSSIKKAKRDLGWEPKISFIEGIRELCRRTRS